MSCPAEGSIATEAPRIGFRSTDCYVRFTYLVCQHFPLQHRLHEPDEVASVTVLILAN